MGQGVEDVEQGVVLAQPTPTGCVYPSCGLLGGVAWLAWGMAGMAGMTWA